MPNGEMRRPPQLWEQRLARTTSVLGVGLSSAGDNTAIVPPTTPPGSGGGTEPAPVLPAPGTFTTPSTPTLSGTVQGIRVSWNGLNSDGDPYPTGAYVEVHISTSSATFTPDASTLAGTLLGSAGFFTIGALTAGTTYFVRLVGVDEAGNRTSPSTAASSQTGLTTSSDYGTATIGAGAVSFNARSIGGITTTVGSTTPSNPVTGDIWLDSSGGAIVHKRWDGSSWVTQAWGSSSISAGAVTATQIAAGAITAGAIAAGAITTDKLNASAVTADKIAASAITADKIDANAITGKLIRTAASGKRVEIQVAGGTNGEIEFYNSSGVKRGSIYGANSYLILDPPNGVEVLGNFYMNLNYVLENLGTTRLGLTGANQYGLRVASADGSVYSYGIDENTTANEANVRVGGSAQLLRSTSTVRLKDELTPLEDDLAGVPPEKLADFPASVDPYDVLTLTPTEFRSLSKADGEARSLGFIAEDVATKLPWAADWDDEGLPAAVQDRPILAALLWVVRDQQATITDLRTRIEALEA